MKKSAYCIIGNPLKHSLSPKMHNAAFKEAGIDCTYVLLESPNVSKAASKIKGFAGCNVTIPYKECIITYLDEMGPEAAAIGAVNTIKNENGKLVGYNTDWIGFVKSLEEHIKIEGEKFVLAGAGGAARAVAYGLSKGNGELTIVNRDVKKAETLAKRFKCSAAGLESIGKIEAVVFINSTSLGMLHNKGAIATKEQLERYRIVFDLIYDPAQTELLRLAREAGCKTINGLDMLVYQAAASFEIWTGVKANIKAMRDAIVPYGDDGYDRK